MKNENNQRIKKILKNISFPMAFLRFSYGSQGGRIFPDK